LWDWLRCEQPIRRRAKDYESFFMGSLPVWIKRRIVADVHNYLGVDDNPDHPDAARARIAAVRFLGEK
jgi:hypothetical protein